MILRDFTKDDGAIQHAYQNALTHIEKMHENPSRGVSHVRSCSSLNKAASSIFPAFGSALKLPSHNAFDAYLAATR